MARCPTCGRSVPSVFEHVDTDCQNWPDRGTPEGDAAEAAYNAIRNFMLRVSPLRRDEISEVLPKAREDGQ